MFRKREELKVRTIHFLGEQDGVPERELKDELRKLFQNHNGVLSAYLARVTYSGQTSSDVALCLSSNDEEAAFLVSQVQHIFASMFGADQHLDIVFVNAEQESELARVCRPFLTRN